MTAPDVNADMRAKFEAGVSRYMGNGRASLARSEESGIYLVPAVESMWLGYRAAHADMAREVRELVEDARWLLSQMPHNEFSHDFIKDEKRCDPCKRIKRIAAALAKHTHQDSSDGN